eukprot:scaffold3674_cov75-Cylindrotheca_fusiformis.AAC.1
MFHSRRLFRREHLPLLAAALASYPTVVSPPDSERLYSTKNDAGGNNNKGAEKAPTSTSTSISSRKSKGHLDINKDWDKVKEDWEKLLATTPNSNSSSSSDDDDSEPSFLDRFRNAVTSAVGGKSSPSSSPKPSSSSSSSPPPSDEDNYKDMGSTLLQA